METKKLDREYIGISLDWNIPWACNQGKYLARALKMIDLGKIPPINRLLEDIQNLVFKFPLICKYLYELNCGPLSVIIMLGMPWRASIMFVRWIAFAFMSSIHVYIITHFNSELSRNYDPYVTIFDVLMREFFLILKYDFDEILNKISRFWPAIRRVFDS